MSRISTFSIALVTSVFALTAAQAADFDVTETTIIPAVSGPNGKIEVGYASYEFEGGPGISLDGGTGYFVQGAFSVPLATRYGLQIDAGYQRTTLDLNIGLGGVDIDVDSYGIGAHLFRRDPTNGLLGVYAHFVHHDFDVLIGSVEAQTYRLALEGELYRGDWTFAGMVGFDHLEFSAGGGDRTDFFGRGEVQYYFTDDFVAKLGIETSFETTFARVGFEAAFSSVASAPTLFADAKFNSDTHQIMAGLKFHFGSEAGKSLKARHREDDPQIALFSNFAAIGNACNEGTGRGLPVRDGRNGMDAIIIGEGFARPSVGACRGASPLVFIDASDVLR